MTRCIQADYLTSATRWPPPSLEPLPQVCFCGRSNVGKSSILNAAVNRKGLARTSSMPGRTQTISVFPVTLESAQARRRAHFVDLPGYGFAKVPLEVKKKWRPMMEGYFSGNALLRGAVVLLDIRREPAEDDMDMLEFLDMHAVPTLVVVTKIDKVAATKRPAELKRTAAGLGIEDWRDLRTASALTGEGVRELLGDLWELVAPAPAGGEASAAPEPGTDNAPESGA